MDTNNIKTIKLSSGEEIVSFVEVDDMEITLNNPCLVSGFGHSNISMRGWLLSNQNNPVVSLSPAAVVSMSEPDEETIEKYLEETKRIDSES